MFCLFEETVSKNITPLGCVTESFHYLIFLNVSCFNWSQQKQIAKKLNIFGNLDL